MSERKKEIADRFLAELEKHLAELKYGLTDSTYEINQFAELLFIDPNHLSDTIKEVLGKSPCTIYEEKLVEISRELVKSTNRPISDIARALSYDPSNFTKFFKRFTGITPKQYRKNCHVSHSKEGSPS